MKLTQKQMQQFATMFMTVMGGEVPMAENRGTKVRQPIVQQPITPTVQVRIPKKNALGIEIGFSVPPKQVLDSAKYETLKAILHGETGIVGSKGNPVPLFAFTAKYGNLWYLTQKTAEGNAAGRQAANEVVKLVVANGYQLVK